MAVRRLRLRLACVAMSSVFLVQAMAAGPSAAIAADPSPPPSTVPTSNPGDQSSAPADSPTATPDASPVASPPPVPSPSPSPMATPDRSEAPAIVPAPRANPDEVPALRTESSQTFDNHDGTLSTDFYTDPIFYKPTGSQTFVPIAVGFAPATDASDAVAVSRDAPVAVAIGPAQADAGFLRLTTADQTVAFALPSASRPQATTVDPRTDGPVADYPDFLPGVDLRVFARAFGAKSFFIWHEAPIDPTITIRVEAPGLTLRLGDDGAIVFVESDGKQFGRMPAPFAVDSSADAGRGGGIFTDKVSYQLAADGSSVTIAVDPTWLKSATYPVFVDPTFNVDNAGSSSYGDAHTASAFPTTNYADYQRPDSPFYHELWLGDDPSGTSGTSAAYLRWNVSSLNYTSITEATLHVYPYHQFSNAPTSSLANVKRVTTSWIETDPKWNNKPGSDPAIVASAYCVEATTCDFDLQSLLQGWADASYSNFGMKLEEPSGQSYWKRLIASEQGGVHTENLHATYHTISGASTTAAFGSTISWTFTDGVGDPQARYRVQVASDAAYTNILADSGLVNSSASSYLPAPPVTPLADDTLYYYRFRVGDTQGLTDWVTGSWRNDAYRRGDETYYASIPFELGGGLRLDVGAHNGEARMSRDLFSIPSYGPPGELSLAYSSLDGSSAGRFGIGWNSNLTQYLSFPSGLVEWHRPDGGRVAFSGSGSTWTVAAAHFEKLTYDGVAHTYAITQKDQTKLVFQDAAPGRLLKIQNRFGKALTLVWNTSSATATDASGRVTSIVIDSANNRITGVTDSAGRAWGFAYTGTDLTTLTDPATKTTTFGYDASHHLTTVSRVRSAADGSHPTITWTMGYTSGKATSVADPIGGPSVTNTFSYNAGNTVVGLLKTYSPVVRNTSTFTYDGSGRVTTILDPGGFTTTSHFDNDQPGGNSLLSSMLRPVDATHWATTSHTYDGAGNALTETDPLTSSTNVTSVMSYNTTNDLVTRSLAESDASVQVVTLNAYDGTGHLLSVTENCTSSGTTLPSPASSCTGGGTHDATWNLVTTYSYTSNDQVDVEWDARGIATKHAHDTYGNETSSIADCTTSGTTPPARGTSCSGAGTADGATNVVTSHAYAATNNGGKVGLPSAMTDPLGAMTTYDYDIFGRETSIVLPSDASIPALTTTTTYDEFDEALTSTNTWPGIVGGNRVTTNVYDYVGHLTLETGLASGTTTTHVFDAAGNETQTVGRGVTINRTNFDWLGGILAEQTAPGTGDEIDTTRTFDAQGGDLSETVDSLLTTKTYDQAGRLTTQTIGGVTTTHHYDALGREFQTDTSGRASTSATFDRDGGATQAVDAAGLKTDTMYDADGNATSVTHPYAGASATALDTTTYDALNRETVTIANYVSGGIGPDENVTTTTVYDAAGRAFAVQDPNGNVTVTVFNLRGLASKVVDACIDAPPPTNWWQCSGNGAKTATQNLTTTTMYDGSGAVLASIQVRVSVPNATTTTVLDAADRIIATQDPRGTVNRTFYDSSGNVYKTVANCIDMAPPANWWDCAGTATPNGTQNLTTTDTFDAAGRKATETAPNGRLTTYSYDDASQLTKIVDNYVATPTLPDQDVTTEYHYDSLGHQDAMKDPSGRITINHYDATSGFLTWVIVRCLNTAPPANWWQCTGTATPDNQTNLMTLYTYDSAGRKVSMAAPDPSAAQAGSGNVTTEYAYGTNGRLCRVLEAASPQTGTVLKTLADPCSTAVSGTTTSNLSTRYLYDDNGNVTSTIDADAHTTAYGYDKDVNMTSLTDADGHPIAWTYDGQGHRLTQTNRQSGSIIWTYDESGNLASRAATSLVAVTYGYDLNGNRTTVTSGSQVITTTYDALNRPLIVTDGTDAGATTIYTYGLTSGTRIDPSSINAFTFTLDAFGREISMTDPIHGAGSPWTTAYAADGQPTSLAAPNGNTTTYGYDPAGRLLTMTTTAAGPLTRAAYTHAYNAAGQRLSENSQITGDTANGTATFTYDPLGRLTTYGGVPGITNQQYGFDKVPNRLTKQVSSGSVVTTTFDAANRPNGDSAGGSYVADLDGRITTRPLPGGSEALSYDTLGRLTSATIGGVATTYTYDPLDRLVTITRGAAVSKLRFVGTTTTIAQVRDGSNVIQYNLATSLGGEPRFDFSGGGVSQRFYGTNGHHDVTWTANASGAVTSTLRYDPWGIGYVTSGSGTDLRFQGSWYDAATALAWAINRWYAPDLGTFTSEDSVLGQQERPETGQLYAYGAGDPVGRTDPTGRFWHLVQKGDSIFSLALKYYGSIFKWDLITAGNPGRRITPLRLSLLTPMLSSQAGKCVWIPQRNLHHECMPYHGTTYFPYGRYLYWRYHATLSFIFDRMVADRVDGAGGVGMWSDCPIFFQWCLPFNLELSASWTAKVRPGGDWDYKAKLSAKYGGGQAYRTPIAGDPAPERLYYDVWTNIHYGYVGRAHKIPADILHAGAEQFGGARSVSDWVSNEAGIQLWDKFRTRLTRGQLADAVLSRMRSYRNDPAYFFLEVRRGLQP